jgi:hypothetical protein
MKSILKVLAISCALAVPSVSMANGLGECLVDSLNGKERKILAKWIYFSIAAHPEMSAYSNLTDEARDDTDEFIGTLITRLLTENCPDQLASSLAQDPLALQKSFELVGRVAMQELMQDQQVVQALTGYVKYLDMDKIKSVTQ